MWFTSLFYQVDRTSNDLTIKNLAPNQTYHIQFFQDIPFCPSLAIIGSINITTKEHHAGKTDFTRYIIGGSMLLSLFIILGAIFTLRQVMIVTKPAKMAAIGLDRSCSTQRLLDKENNGLNSDPEQVYTISGQNLVT